MQFFGMDQNHLSFMTSSSCRYLLMGMRKTDKQDVKKSNNGVHLVRGIGATAASCDSLKVYIIDVIKYQIDAATSRLYSSYTPHSTVNVKVDQISRKHRTRRKILVAT